MRAHDLTRATTRVPARASTGPKRPPGTRRPASGGWQRRLSRWILAPLCALLVLTSLAPVAATAQTAPAAEPTGGTTPEQTVGGTATATCAPAPGVGEAAPWATFADPFLEAVYRQPSVDLVGTDCTGANAVASGYPVAAIGSGACLADPDVAVQPAAGPFPCSAVTGRQSSGTGDLDAPDSRASLVLEAAVHRAAATGVQVDSQSSGTALQQYRVVAPDGAPVDAEVRVRSSVAVDALVAGDPTGDAAYTTATADLQGAVQIQRLVDDPECAPDASCEPVIGGVADAARFSVHDTAEHCRACVRVVDGQAQLRADHRAAERTVTATSTDEVGGTADLVDPGDARGDGPGALELLSGSRADWVTPAVTIPVQLQGGDVLTEDLRLVLDASASGTPGDARSQVGVEVDVVSRTPGATIVPLQSLATPQLPVLQIGDTEVTETATDTTVDVPVTLSAPAATDVTVEVGTEPGTAGSEDLGVVATTVTIPAGATQAAVPVTIRADAIDELDEAFLVRMTAPTGAALLTDLATVTIHDDDPTPRLELSPVQTVWEDDEQTHVARLTARLSAPAGYDVPFTWEATAGTADAADAALGSHGAVIPAGQYATTLDIAVHPDARDEATEQFDVRILTVDAGASGIEVSPRAATVRVLDSHGLLGLSPVGPSVVEGDLGQSPAWVSFTMPGAQPVDVVVDYSVVAGRAGAEDTRLGDGSVTIPAGQTQAFTPSTVFGDVLPEGDEGYRLQVRSVAGGPWAQDDGLVTIVDDEALPSLSIGDVRVVETRAAEGFATVPVTVTPVSDHDITVSVRSMDNTAEYNDYQPVSQTVTIPAGSPAAVLQVPIKPDSVDEKDENFTLALADATMARIDDGWSFVTIEDDDASPRLLLTEDATVYEDDQQVRHARLSIRLSEPAGYSIPVSWETVPGTAGTTDFVPQRSTKTIPAGAAGVTVDVPVKADAVSETVEYFDVRVTGIGAGMPPVALPSRTGHVVIEDASAATGLAVSSTWTPEGDQGSAPSSVAITIPTPLTSDLAVAYELRNGTAVAPGDYVAGNGTVVIPAGRTEAFVTVREKGDRALEGLEVLTVAITDAKGQSVQRSSGVVGLTDDERVRLSVSDAMVVESDVEARTARVTVSLSQPLGTPLNVQWRTVETHATSGVDYWPRTSDAVIPAGATFATVLLPVLPDGVAEYWESFDVEVTGVDSTLVDVVDATGTVVITDSYATFGEVRMQGGVVTEGDVGTRRAWAMVSLPAPQDRDVVVSYELRDVDATAGVDYVRPVGKVVVPAGSTSVGVPLTVKGDRDTDRELEVATLVVTDAEGLPVASEAGYLYIRDDDAG